MPDISSFVTPSNTEYNFKDAAAREAIASLQRFEFHLVTGAADTPYGVQWDDDGTTITGTLVASADTKGIIYFVPTEDASGNNYYDEYVTISPTSSTYGWELFGSTSADVGSLGALAFKDSASGSYTPSGSISVNAASGSGTSYTPEGTVAAPTISVASAGSTATIHNPTKATVATAVTAAAPGATAPNNPITYYAVDGEKLKLYQLGYNTGDSISTSDVTVKTGDASYSASAPVFSGTEKKLAFSGSSATITVE